VAKYQLEVFDFENNYLSSTKIRNLESLDLQIKPVNDYINNNLMYLYERLETKMDEKTLLPFAQRRDKWRWN
jgi:nicotinate-nucleotide adenylyltransferase